MSNYIYFDNAATSYPKPKSVIAEVANALKLCGGNPGRSGHKLSLNSSKAIFECREAICKLFNTKSPERVIFTANATQALNMSIKGLACDNSHIIISNLEHNSVLRPVYSLTDRNKAVTYSFFDATGDDTTVVNSFLNSIENNTKVAVISLASNICGKITPIEKISKICQKKGIYLIVDASQAAGEVPIDFTRIGASILCTAGHKGLFGPMGTGFMILSENLDSDELETIIEGGSGVNSLDMGQGNVLPERFEAGTLNTPGICGLKKGVDFVFKRGVSSIYEENLYMITALSEGLKNIAKVREYGDYSTKTPVVLFNIEKMLPDEVSKCLDELNICTRSGFHCSPIAHQALKTGEHGAVRVSLGFMNTMHQVDRFLVELNRIAK